MSKLGMRSSVWLAGFLGLFAGRSGVAQSARGGGEVSLPALASAEFHNACSVEQSELSARMDQFLRAVRGGDVDSISSFFPRRGDWTYQRTRHTRDGRQVGQWKFGAEDTQQAIRSGPLTSSFRMNYERQTIGSLIHQVKVRRGGWQQLSGPRFIPPGAANGSDTFVTWRLQDGAWVVSSVADEVFAGSRLPSWCC